MTDQELRNNCNPNYLSVEELSHILANIRKNETFLGARDKFIEPGGTFKENLPKCNEDNLPVIIKSSCKSNIVPDAKFLETVEHTSAKFERTFNKLNYTVINDNTNAGNCIIPSQTVHRILTETKFFETVEHTSGDFRNTSKKVSFTLAKKNTNVGNSVESSQSFKQSRSVNHILHEKILKTVKHTSGEFKSPSIDYTVSNNNTNIGNSVQSSQSFEQPTTVNFSSGGTVEENLSKCYEENLPNLPVIIKSSCGSNIVPVTKNNTSVSNSIESSQQFELLSSVTQERSSETYGEFENTLNKVNYTRTKNNTNVGNSVLFSQSFGQLRSVNVLPEEKLFETVQDTNGEFRNTSNEFNYTVKKTNTNVGNSFESSRAFVQQNSVNHVLPEGKFLGTVERTSGDLRNTSKKVSYAVINNKTNVAKTIESSQLFEQTRSVNEILPKEKSFETVKHISGEFECTSNKFNYPVTNNNTDESSQLFKQSSSVNHVLPEEKLHETVRQNSGNYEATSNEVNCTLSNSAGNKNVGDSILSSQSFEQASSFNQNILDLEEISDDSFLTSSVDLPENLSPKSSSMHWYQKDNWSCELEGGPTLNSGIPCQINTVENETDKAESNLNIQVVPQDEPVNYSFDEKSEDNSDYILIEETHDEVVGHNPEFEVIYSSLENSRYRALQPGYSPTCIFISEDETAQPNDVIVPVSLEDNLSVNECDAWNTNKLKSTPDCVIIDSETNPTFFVPGTNISNVEELNFSRPVMRNEEEYDTYDVMSEDVQTISQNSDSSEELSQEEIVTHVYQNGNWIRYCSRSEFPNSYFEKFPHMDYEEMANVQNLQNDDENNSRSDVQSNAGFENRDEQSYENNYPKERDDIEHPGWNDFRTNLCEKELHKKITKLWKGRDCYNPKRNLSVSNYRYKRIQKSGKNAKCRESVDLKRKANDTTQVHPRKVGKFYPATFLEDLEIQRLKSEVKVVKETIEKEHKLKRKQLLQKHKNFLNKLVTQVGSVSFGEGHVDGFSVHLDGILKTAKKDLEKCLVLGCKKLDSCRHLALKNITRTYTKSIIKSLECRSEIQTVNEFYKNLGEEFDATTVDEEELSKVLEAEQLILIYEDIYKTAKV